MCISICCHIVDKKMNTISANEQSTNDKVESATDEDGSQSTDVATETEQQCAAKEQNTEPISIPSVEYSHHLLLWVSLHTCTHTHTHTHTHPHTHTHAHTHTHLHTHTHTHTHTPTPPPPHTHTQSSLDLCSQPAGYEVIPHITVYMHQRLPSRAAMNVLSTSYQLTHRYQPITCTVDY